MKIPKELLNKYPEINDSILIGYRGSISHGLYVPQSNVDSIDDKDIMCIYIPNKEYYLGLNQYSSKGTKEIKYKEYDIVIYEFRKFISLLCKGNPNVLSMLYLDKSHYIKVTNEGRMILKARNLFVSKQVYHSFVGYAYGQLHRMTHTAFKGYMGEKRKQLVNKYGYDVKNASHLIRLLKMGIEFLIEGKLYVKRKDSHELLAIKRGEWSLDKVKSRADELFSNINVAYTKSTLPNEVSKGEH